MVQPSHNADIRTCKLPTHICIADKHLTIFDCLICNNCFIKIMSLGQSVQCYFCQRRTKFTNSFKALVFGCLVIINPNFRPCFIDCLIVLTMMVPSITLKQTHK